MSSLTARLVVALTLCATLSACAARRGPGPENDPIEGVNRKVFWFNDKVDV